MTLPWKIAIAVLLFSMVALMIADLIYKTRHPWSPERRATIGGRTGIVTSYWPFDLIVEINAEATEDERGNWVERQMARTDIDTLAPATVEWIKETASHLRVWPRAWRWNVDFSAEAKR